MDYLMAEAELRSDGQISFPKGFITPKVGPHRTYGFAPGQVYGVECELIMRQGLVSVDSPYMEYITALDENGRTLYVVLMNSDDEARRANLSVDITKLFGSDGVAIKEASFVGSQGSLPTGGSWDYNIDAYGIKVLKIKY